MTIKNEKYIDKVLLTFGHNKPTKRQLSPPKNWPITYGAKSQIALNKDTSPKLNESRIKLVQWIIGALLYYARNVDNKPLISLSDIGAQQAADTQETAGAVIQLLNYVATYPDDGITYHSSGMVLTTLADAWYFN